MATSTEPYALVVDDDALIRMDVCDTLTLAGFRCYEAASGDEAKDLLGKLADNVILLFSDVDMPGATNGFSLAKHVSQHWPWIEIVIASGRVKPSSDDLPPKATFISKPFQSETVIGHLRKKLPDGKKPQPLKSAV